MEQVKLYMHYDFLSMLVIFNLYGSAGGNFWNNREIKLPYTYFKLLFVGVMLLQHDDLSLDLCKREPNEILFIHAFLLQKLTNRMMRKISVSKKQYAVLVGNLQICLKVLEAPSDRLIQLLHFLIIYRHVNVFLLNYSIL